MTLVKTGGGITDIHGGFGGVYFHRDKSGLHSCSKPRTVYRRSAAQNLQRNAFTAARRWSKDNRTVSYLIYRHLNGLPFLFDAIVTGNPVPDCTGTYKLLDKWNDRDRYLRQDGEFYLSYYALHDLWTICRCEGDPVGGRWYHQTLIEGVYDGYFTYTGNPVVKLQVQPPPLDYQIPHLQGP